MTRILMTFVSAEIKIEDFILLTTFYIKTLYVLHNIYIATFELAFQRS